MKSLLVLLLSSVALAAALPAPMLIKNHGFKPSDFPATAEDASNLLDQLLATVREQLEYNGFDRIPIPDQHLGFEQEIGGVIWHGEADLTNGTLHNMDTIHRTGPATVDQDASSTILVSADVGVNRGKLDFDMSVKFMDLGPTVKVDGELSRVRVLLQLKITTDMQITLEKFDIKDTGLLSVDIKGLGAVLNFLVEIVANFLGNLLKGIVALLLEGTIKDMINDIIGGIINP